MAGDASVFDISTVWIHVPRFFVSNKKYAGAKQSIQICLGLGLATMNTGAKQTIQESVMAKTQFFVKKHTHPGFYWV